MDKKLLDALNNLSVALQQIADSLDPKKKKTSSIGNALSTNNIDKKLKSIDAGIKQIQSDNKQIIKNQEKILSGQQTLLSLSKKQPTKVSPLDKVTDPNQDSGIKGGLGTVLMIAAGVLAIGLAFKIIGNVNVMSVLAIALALPLIAMAFEEIAKMKDLKPEQMKNLVKVSVAMATAITLSSWILAFVIPISISQLGTSIAIAAMFTVVSYGLNNILKNIKDIKPAQIKNLALVMAAVSLAIVASSLILNFVIPVSPGQLITSILIAGMFTAVSYGFDKLLTGLRKVKTTDLANLAILPLIMLAISVAIVASSVILQGVIPISLPQLATAIVIAAMFGVISLGMGKMLEGLRDIQPQDYAILEELPVIFTLFSIAIVISSAILQAVRPVNLFKLLTAVAIAAAFVVISYSIKPLMEGIKGVSLKDIAIGGLVLVSITLAIVAASWILMGMAPIKFSTVILFATTALAIAVSSVALAIAFKLINAIGKPVEYALGGLSVLIIAGVIALSSRILSLGDYKEGSYPGIGWTLGVGLSLVLFGGATLLLGMLVMETGGTALAVLALGALAMGMVALTIVGISQILKLGDYKEGNYPSIGWSMGVGLALYPLAFSAMLIGALVLTGVGAVALGVGLLTMYGIAKTVVKIAKLFNGVNWSKYPDVKWAKGVGTSLSAFGKIMGDVGLKGILLNKIGAIFGTGPEDLADQMIKVDKKFADAGDTAFTKYPNQDWANNVGGLLLKFAELQTSGGVGGFVAGLTGNLKRTAQSIVDVDKKLAEGNYTKYPKSDWSTSVATLLKSFADASSSSSLGDALKNKLTGSPFTAIAQNIVDVSKKLSEGKYTNGMPGDYMTSLANNIKSFIEVSNLLDNSKLGNVNNTVDNIKKISDGYSELAKGLNKIGGELSKIDTDKLQALKNLTGSIVLMSLMDSDQFEKMMSALEDKAKIFVGVMNDLDGGESKGLKTGTSAVKTPSGGTANNQKTINDLYLVMSSVDASLSSIAKSSGNVSKYVDEIRTGESPLKRDKKK